MPLVADGAKQLPNFMSTLPVTTACITASDQNVMPSQVISSMGKAFNPLATTFSPFTSVKEIAETTWVYTNSQPGIPISQPLSTTANQKIEPSEISSGVATAVSNNSHFDKGLFQLAKSFADQMSLNRIPPPEPNIFSGDPIQYSAWKAAFNMLIDGKSLPPGEKYITLKGILVPW